MYLAHHELESVKNIIIIITGSTCAHDEIARIACAIQP